MISQLFALWGVGPGRRPRRSVWSRGSPRTVHGAVTVDEGPSSIIVAMDDVKLGRVLRAIRRRKGLRQIDVGVKAGCGQSTISLIERGHMGRLSIRRVRLVAAALDARFEGLISWRGGDADRLTDSRHAALVEEAAARFRRLGWDVSIEVSYSRYGERGSIDLLASRPEVFAVAVSEMKSEITAIEELARRHDEKTRLAGDICHERFGWRPHHVAKLLVVPEDRTIRRIVARHRATFAAAYPMGNVEIHHWLVAPSGWASGVWFLPLMNRGGASRSAVRVRTANRRALRSAGNGSRRILVDQQPGSYVARTRSHTARQVLADKESLAQP